MSIAQSRLQEKSKLDRCGSIRMAQARSTTWRPTAASSRAASVGNPELREFANTCKVKRLRRTNARHCLRAGQQPRRPENMRRLGIRCGALLAGLVALSLGSISAASARNVTDSAGRLVEVPDTVTRVHAAGPPASTLLYTLAPQKMI